MPDAADQAARIAELTAELAEARRIADELARAARRKDEFLSAFAHELRNPLSPILHASYLVGTAAAASPKLTWCAEVIERQIGHLARRIDDLHDVACLARGRITVSPAPLALDDAIDDALDANRALIEARRHEVHRARPDRPVQLVGDRRRLAQIVGQLLENAARHTPEGGRIELTLRRDGAHVLVAVSDNGIGIEPARLAGLFEPFAEPGIDACGTGRKGLGIGLALARRFAELHGGGIDAHSAGPGCGSVFTLRLPLPPGDDAPAR